MIADLLKDNLSYFRSITIENGFNKSLKSIKIDNSLNIDILKQDLLNITNAFLIKESPIDNW